MLNQVAQRRGGNAAPHGRSMAAFLAWAAIAFLASAPAPAATLILDGGDRKLAFSTEDLLARPDVREIEIAGDIAYRETRRYRAIPLPAVLASLPAAPGSMLETVALDGYVASIPLHLVRRTAPGGARAWLAIEPSDGAWGNMPNKTSGAGPFYIVWERPEAAGVISRYWGYKLAALRYVPAPEVRWPQIAVDRSLPAGHPARRGQEFFSAFCLNCHRMNDGGGSTVGPDLNVPMNPTEYFQPGALRRFLRDPASVRNWQGMSMKGVTPNQLSDRDLEALIAYLEHMAGRRKAAPITTAVQPRRQP